MITKQEKKKILEEAIDNLKKSLVNVELDLRYLNREKIRAKEGQLGAIQENITRSGEYKLAIESKIEVALDMLKEV